VYKTLPSSLTLEERELAALLYVGDGAALSHLSAARHWRLDVPPNGRVQLTVPFPRAIVSLEGTQVWRSRDLDDPDVVRRGPLRLTRLGRTVLDLASLLDAAWLRACVDSALRHSRANLGAMRSACDRLTGGHRGARTLRALLESYETDDDVADSALESLAMELGLATGRKPRLHHRISDRARLVAEVDLAWPEHRFCLELDSWKHHGSREAFDRDRARDRALLAQGWTVLRYTWRQITADRDAVVRELVEALRRTAAARHSA
jgi:very-short-patch-repair endonuclease